MEAFPCKLFVHVQREDNPKVLLGIPDRFMQPTVAYLHFYKQLGLALGLAEDPHQRGIRIWRHPMGTNTYGRARVSIMTSNLKDHLNRLEWGYLLPELSINDEAAICSRFCSK